MSAAAAGTADARTTKVSSSHAGIADRVERSVVLVHRWIGIAGCLLLLVWFVSGVVIAYVRYPAMSRADKLAVLKPLDWQNVRVGPGRALNALGLSSFPKEVRLVMRGGIPVYRITMWNRDAKVVSATTGQVLGPVLPLQALAIVKEQLNAPKATLMSANLYADQWTIGDPTEAYRPPFDRVALNDGAGTQYYVAANSGEIVQRTTRSQRVLNYFGAIPHWTYITYLRGTHYVAWLWTEYVLITIGIFVVISGSWIGIKRIRIRKLYASGRHSPFSGWKFIHHSLGIIGGLFIVTWTCTAMLAMTPGGFLVGRQLEHTDVTNFMGTRLAQFPAINASALRQMAPDAKRATFTYMAGDPVIVIDGGNSGHSFVINAHTMRRMSMDASSFARAARLLDPKARLQTLTWLKHGDNYWHSAFDPVPIPIIRARFSDGLDFYINPSTAGVAGVVDHTDRIFQWTERLLHDLDWHWLIQHPALWDLVLMLTILPGVAVSLSGVVIGTKRLWKTAERRPLLSPVPALGSGGMLDWFTQVDASSTVSNDLGPTEKRVLLTYATQTGVAGELSEKLQSALVRAGLDVRRLRLADLTPADLSVEPVVLCVVSTSGEGEPPDDTVRFRREYMGRAASLEKTRFAVIALGDSEYPRYCGFGKEVELWLLKSGAKRMFRTVEVDRGDSHAVDRWVRCLERQLGVSIDLEQGRTCSRWVLTDRMILNTGSAGGELFKVVLEPADAAPHWLPGDIARVQAGVDWDSYIAGTTAPARDYSIASLPDYGRIVLLVRLMRNQNGQPGVGSGWLWEAPIGTYMAARIRSNIGFHPSQDEHAAIFIGNGTGYAGIRAHLLYRAQRALGPTWLFFGERNRAVDYICREDIEEAKRPLVTNYELAFSRDQPYKIYVQDLMLNKATEIKRWVADGCCVYVCGSRHGMAPGVHSALIHILGGAELERMTFEGRYRRDVY